ncbi:MAG: hypothetical protein LBF38_04285 [Deltaproteobacteria bacterium]|jgi:hypothetical protein|nr:hypothetical protein [Deltaproteobacteria bacterium]
MQIPDPTLDKSPFRKSEPKEGKGFRRLERLVRLAALLLLCGLVWYFSYDHGRTDTVNKTETVNRKVSKLELENESLREKLTLAEMDLTAAREELTLLKDRLAKGEGSLVPAGQSPGQNAQSPQAPSEPQAEVVPPEGGAIKAPESLDQPGPAKVGPSENRERFTLRAMENKAAFNGQAVLSLVDLNSLDREVTVRIRYADSGRREARVMVPGDLIDFQLGDGTHSLYLDQIRGNMAFFILDGLPVETSSTVF